MRSHHLVTATASLLMLAACADQHATLTAPPLAASRNVTSETSSELWESIVTGETGPGSVYALYKPREWNGTVVYYSHGIRNILNEPDVSLRDQNGSQTVRDQLGALGYAFAYSSFDENGYVVKDAAQRTHQLRGLFTSRFGQPERSLLVGHSLGGLASLDLAERFSKQYDGVASFCGITGGTQAELDHIINTRLLFDLYYPGVLLGAYNEIPRGYNIDPSLDPVTSLRIQSAVLANPVGLLVIANTAQTWLEFSNDPRLMLSQMIQSLITKLTFHAAGYDNLLAQTNGKFPFDNTQTQYQSIGSIVVPPPLNGMIPSSLIEAQIASLDARVPRTPGEVSALNYADKYFTPSGALTMPTVTLHNRWDPLVPYAHEPLFASRVDAAGARDRLLPRTVDSYGHCSFSVADQVRAIVDLDGWLKTGTKPAS